MLLLLLSLLLVVVVYFNFLCIFDNLSVTYFMTTVFFLIILYIVKVPKTLYFFLHPLSGKTHLSITLIGEFNCVKLLTQDLLESVMSGGSAG